MKISEYSHNLQTWFKVMENNKKFLPSLWYRVKGLSGYFHMKRKRSSELTWVTALFLNR